MAQPVHVQAVSLGELTGTKTGARTGGGAQSARTPPAARGGTQILGKFHLRYRDPLVAQRQVPMDETVRETLEVSQLPFIDKVVDTLVGAETDLERLFPQTCVSHVRRGSLRGSSSCCC